MLTYVVHFHESAIMIVHAHATIHRPARRRGTIVSLLALTLVALMAFLAMAIDLGMLSIAKTQAQQAADLAALTAARTLNGDSTNNYNMSAATTNARNLMTYNYVLGQPVQPTHTVALTYGSYDYSPASQTFGANFPASSGVPYTAVAATVTTTSLPGAFCKVLGIQLLPNVSATAQAVHRPRDIGLAMDLSSSMRYGTMLGFDITLPSRATNNPDTVVPTFGHYSSASASLIGTTSNRTSVYDNYTVSPSNTTAANASYTQTYINGFYQNALSASTLIRAFDSYTSVDGGKTWSAPAGGTTPALPPASYATTPGGDAPLFVNGSSTAYATNVSDVVGSSSANILWELDGYSAYVAGKPDSSGSGGIPAVWSKADYSTAGTQLNGYTQGPGYYGKTMFVWPPDPRNTNSLSGAALTSYLSQLGINAADQATLSGIWSTWQSQAPSVGLANLQNWLTGTATGGASALPTFTGNYTPTSTTALVPGITTWNGTAITSSNAPSTYYAVCRLFNRAYPAGSSNGAYSADWRLRFFGSNDNTALFNASGKLNRPGTFSINYNAILAWITQGANPFPTQMRAGRIRYYGAIPTSITGTWPNYGGTDQRFWVEFIDHVLGFRQTASGVYTDVSAMTGYGKDITWGATGITAPPGSATQYMSYTDNPARPLLRYWFSPILMVDYLHNYNLYQNVGNYYVMQPGDSYEAPIYTAREGFQGSINSMQNNHPNDWFTLALYARPRNSAADNLNRFNCVHCPLGTNYDYAIASLYFPFSTFNADGSSNGTEITPYDGDAATGSVPAANFSDVPRAKGGTCFAMALMLCYNQFAVTSTTDGTLRNYVSNTPITFPGGMAGGMGRKGAQKVIIFETDGIPECRASASLVSGGSYNYYQIRYDMNVPASSEYPTVLETFDGDPVVSNQVYSLIDQLNSTYGTTRNPFKLYAIGFGPVFSGADASIALNVLQNMQYHGNTQSDPSTGLPSNQIITGTDAQMSANLVSVYTSILQNGVQIALIK
jgi:Flp pilus assembly protein TadG